jgi:hypothetical protein
LPIVFILRAPGIMILWIGAVSRKT